MKVGHRLAPSLERGRSVLQYFSGGRHADCGSWSPFSALAGARPQFCFIFLNRGGVLVKAVLGCLGAILRHLVLRHPGAILGHLGAVLGFVVLSCSLLGTIEGRLDTARSHATGGCGLLGKVNKKFIFDHLWKLSWSISSLFWGDPYHHYWVLIRIIVVAIILGISISV